ncbi:MAG: phage tail protein [Acetivibrio sp.]
MLEIFNSKNRLMNNYKFQVFIGHARLSFSKVEGLAETLEFDRIEEGGVNDYVHIRQTNRKQEQTLRFSKGVKSTDQLLKVMKPGMRIEGGLLIIIKNTNSIFGMQIYTVDEPIVTRWELGALDALNGEVLVETFEISHNGIRRQ